MSDEPAFSHSAKTPSGWRSLLDLVTTIALLAAAGLVVQHRWMNGADGSRPEAKPLPTNPISLQGLPTLGSPVARVALVIYSDFECPYCARFAREDFPQIEDRFIKTGRVLASFASFPLIGIHAHAADSAIAADCAYRQGRFWQLHDAIFRSRTRLDPTTLSYHAKDIGLDMAQYSSCFNDAGRDERVAWFVRSAKEIGAEGTPTFVVGWFSEGQVKAVKRLNGAAGVDVISRELDALIHKS